MKFYPIEQLRPIGWDYVVWTAPNQSRRLLHNIILAGDQPTPQDDKAQAEILQSLRNNVTACLRDLDMISAQSTELIDLANTPFDQRDQGSIETIKTARRALEDVYQGVIDTKDLLAHSALHVKRGSQPNYRARDAAIAMAEIYVIGRGTMPTFGITPDGTAPSTLFGRTVASVLKELDIKASVVTTGHLKKAVEYVSNPSVFQKLISYRDGAGRSEKWSIMYYLADQPRAQIKE